MGLNRFPEDCLATRSVLLRDSVPCICWPFFVGLRLVVKVSNGVSGLLHG